MIGSISGPQTKLLSLELSRSYKENHGTKFLKICKASCDLFSNLVAVLSATQANIYDTNNLDQGHMDIISHYTARGNDKFVDCCWLANESDGYLAILLESGDIELLSLSYSSIISIINLPGSIKISKIFPDPTDGERVFGVDKNSDTLHIFSFDGAVESPLVDSQALDGSFLYESCGELLEISGDRSRMRPLISTESFLEISESGKIEFASARKISESLDYFIIDQNGRIFYLHSDKRHKITSSLWSKRASIAHDGDNLLVIICTDGNLGLFDLDKNDFSVYKGAFKGNSNASEAVCLFIEPADCCSQGKVGRVLIGDDCGLMSIYRIVQ